MQAGYPIDLRNADQERLVNDAMQSFHLLILRYLHFIDNKEDITDRGMDMESAEGAELYLQTVSRVVHTET